MHSLPHKVPITIFLETEFIRSFNPGKLPDVECQKQNIQRNCHFKSLAQPGQAWIVTCLKQRRNKFPSLFERKGM